jgi:UDP-N-acetylmuramoyl-tripeptide--D-alanyl-D-alanine ligase
MKASEIAVAVGGELFGRDAFCEGATQDSRAIRGGELFVPVVAERDGHDFIVAAVRAGAAAYLTAGPPQAGTAICVDDTSRALLALGSHARSRLPDRVVGVTGSVGKTSTKDLLRGVLAARFRTAASERSFNNEIGAPLTLVNAPESTEAVVVEMGARGVGHIALLCGVARPTIGVVTAVASAHLEMFGTVDDVAKAKGELVEALPPDGYAILNADDHRVAAMAGRTDATVVTFGVGGGDVRGEAIRLDDVLRPTFTVHSDWGRADVSLAIRGRHQVGNALAALASGLVAGVPFDRAVEALQVGELSPMRMQVRRLPGGALLIDDAYNANPTSVRAALAALAEAPATRRTAVLGVMAELGPDGDREHAAIAAEAGAAGIRVISMAAPAYDVAGGDAAADGPEVLDRLGPLGPDDAVLVKGSRVAAMEQVVEALVSRS